MLIETNPNEPGANPPRNWDAPRAHRPLLAGLALAYVAAQAVALTFLGLAIGARVGRTLQERAELVAGMLFIVLGAGVIVATWAGLRVF